MNSKMPWTATDRGEQVFVAYNKGFLGRHKLNLRLARKICAAAVAAVFSLSASSLWALGLGEIEARSYLGDVFQARIGLVSIDGDIDTNNLIVRQVPLEEAEEMGVEYFYSPYRFEFEVQEADDAIFVTVKTREVVKEPFLDLLVELRWPSGVVFRQYSVLLDPAPVITQAEKSQVQKPLPRPQPAAPQKTAPVSIPVRSREQTSNKPNLQASDDQYRVRPGDSLYKIADNWRQGTDAGLNETSEWIFENNPQAFVRGDMNLIKAGVSLRMPNLGAGDLSKAPQSLSDQTDTGPTVSSNTKVPEVLDEPENREKSLDDFAGEDSESTKGLLTVGNATRDDRTRELIDLLVRENQALKARMERLESSEYLSTMRELVLLQRQQIEELRYELGVDGGATAEEVDKMLERIGLDEKVVLSDKSVVSETPVTSANPDANDVENREALPETDDAALVTVAPSAIVTPEESDSIVNKPWFLWVVLVAGAAIAGIFAGIFVFYRKMTAMPAEEYEDEEVYDDEEELQPLDDDSTVLEEIRAEPELKSEADVDLSELEGEHLSIDLDMNLESHDEFLSAENGEWFGEKAGFDEPDEELAETIKNIQQEFSDLPISDMSEVVAGEPLEAITQELNKEAAERRPDDEVKMSIAEKMANYNPDISRSGLEVSGLELDHLEDFYSDDEDDVEGVVYRALMYCEFKKFEEARALVQHKMTEIKDDMLDSTLKKIETMESDYQKRASG